VQYLIVGGVKWCPPEADTGYWIEHVLVGFYRTILLLRQALDIHRVLCKKFKIFICWKI